MECRAPDADSLKVPNSVPSSISTMGSPKVKVYEDIRRRAWKHNLMLLSEAYNSTGHSWSVIVLNYLSVFVLPSKQFVTKKSMLDDFCYIMIFHPKVIKNKDKTKQDLFWYQLGLYFKLVICHCFFNPISKVGNTVLILSALQPKAEDNKSRTKHYFARKL